MVGVVVAIRMVGGAVRVLGAVRAVGVVWVVRVSKHIQKPLKVLEAV